MCHARDSQNGVWASLIMANTSRSLLLVPHEKSHGIMTTLETPRMLLPKARNIRAIKDTMTLVTDSIGQPVAQNGWMDLPFLPGRLGLLDNGQYMAQTCDPCAT